MARFEAPAAAVYAVLPTAEAVHGPMASVVSVAALRMRKAAAEIGVRVAVAKSPAKGWAKTMNSRAAAGHGAVLS
jgi:hypothetical protein